MSVLTSIDLDHKAYLGNTLEEVAREKAGIIKPGVPVVSGPQAPEVRVVIEAAAAGQSASLRWIADPVPADVAVALPGSHQRVNAALALAALEAAGIGATPAEARAGLASVDWPGRFQRLEEGRIILDGAHNPAAAGRLVQTWTEECGAGTRATLILGVLQDKDVAGICRMLVPLSARIYAVEPASPRALPAGELCAALMPCAGTRAIRAAADLADAIERAREHPEPILVAGSLFLVGEALSSCGPSFGVLEVSRQ